MPESLQNLGNNSAYIALAHRSSGSGSGLGGAQCNNSYSLAPGASVGGQNNLMETQAYSRHDGGAGEVRTPYLFNAIEALSQMSYSPT